MGKESSFFCSTIGRKQLVGITGLALSLFVLTHMLGNLLIFVSPEAYNIYGHKLASNPLIYIAEAGLVGIFLVHMVLAISLTRENNNAKGQEYAVSADGDKATSLVQKTMIHQGMVIFIFLIWHLITFKYGSYYEYTSVESGEVIRDLYRLILEVFESPIYIIGYVLCLIVLGMHLSHGVSSAIRTLGFNHPQYDKKVRLAGTIYATIVLVGFLSQPAFVYFFK